MESRNERWYMQDMQDMPLQKDETYEGEVHLSEEKENGKEENEIIMFKRELLYYEPATLFIEYKSTSSYLRGKKNK